MKTLTFQISDEAYDLMVKIGNKSAEYRDTRYETLNDFKESDEFSDGIRSEESFMNRNFGGTFYLISELEKYDLVMSDGESWHLTYILTEFGKEMLQKNNN